MNLTVFGVTGRAGRLLLAQALEAGHQVTVLARTPSKLEMDHEQLTVIEGDGQDPQKVTGAVVGSDAILSVLGPTNNQPTYEVSRGMDHILAAMDQQGVRRLVQSVGAGVGDPQDQPGLLDRLIKVALQLVFRHVYEDMVRVADAIRHSDLEWTLVRVPMLTDDPPTGNVKVGYLGTGVGSRLARADLAAFVLQQADDPTYAGQAPVISN